MATNKNRLDVEHITEACPNGQPGCTANDSDHCNKCGACPDTEHEDWCSKARESSFNERDNMDTENETDELIKEAQVTDNPFSGFGRPFSNDNPLMSEQYFQENPAAATSPYSGPSSYSINTVAPYNPPNSGKENPSQNVGPYMPPGHVFTPDFDVDDMPGAQETDNDVMSHAVQASYQEWDQADSWYDGTPESIYNRIVAGSRILREASYAGEIEVEDTLTEQIEVLTKVANEISDANLEEYLEEVPGGLVALEYDDLSEGGLVDTQSFLHTTAALVIKEANETDWDAFATEGAKRWIANKVDDNPGLLRHETMVRKAAVDYAKDKTMVLMDPLHRAEVIDGFVTNAERFRREASNTLHKILEEEAEIEVQKETLRQMQASAADEYDDEFFPGHYVEMGPDFMDGSINIGEDDGTMLYTAAAESIESTQRDWPEFTTEGAREWFNGCIEKNAGILKSPDLTYRASLSFAKQATESVRDEAIKNAVINAFAESVEYLRDQFENSRTASVEPEYNEFDEIYGNEDEILW